MSIFLRPGQIKVRDDTGEFTSINVMAETSADEIINDIEAAGQEVIESIPADYTALTEEVDELNERLDAEGLSEDSKTALLNCFAHIAWIDEHGQDYYNNLYNALYGEQPISLPDISVGEWERGYFWDTDGSEHASNYSIINRTYYPVLPETQYTWVQGFSSYMQSGEAMTGEMNAYKVCMYDENKTFIGYASNDNIYSTDISIIEQRYFTFTTLPNTAFIRIACRRWPVGFFANQLPTDIYSVVIVYKKADGSNFVSSDAQSVSSAISVFRNNTNITLFAKTGISTLQSIDNETYQWGRGEFGISSGANAEGGPATFSRARYIVVKNMLLKEGDTITINGLNVSIWAQKLTGGEIQHTTTWLTSGDTFTIGG